MPVTGVIAIRWPVADLHTLSGVGAGITLEAYTISSGAVIDNSSISWSTDNADILSVSSSGFVTTVAGGTANVVATTTDGAYTATYEITVINAPAPVSTRNLSGISSINVFWQAIPSFTSFTLNGVDAGLGLVSYTNTGVDITSTTTWTSSNTNVATVSSSGFVTSVGGGTCNITGSYVSDGNTLTDSFEITVQNAPVIGGGGGGASGVTSISIFWPGNSSLSSFTLSGVGAGLGLEAYTYTNVGITYDVTWESSNTNVATISSGGFISAVGGGNCTITATYVSDGNTLTDTYAITVINAPVIGPTSGGPVTGVLPITCSIPGLTKLYGVNSGLQLYSSTVPVDADDPTLVWTSSNTNVATIDSSGFINTVGGGWTEISVRANSDATKVAPNKYTIFVDAPYVVPPPTVTTNTLASNTSASLIQSLRTNDTATSASIISSTSTSSTIIARTEQVSSSTSQAVAVVVDKSGLSNTISTQGQVVAVNGSVSVNMFAAANPSVTKLGIAVEKIIDEITAAVTEVKIIAVKLDSEGNVIPSDINNTATFDTVNATIPRSSYLTIAHTDGTTTSTFGYVDFSTVEYGQLFTFSNDATIVILGVTASTVDILYRGPFSETNMTPSDTPPAGVDPATQTNVNLPSGGGGGNVPCFPAGTRILTAAGYKAVETITQDDKVVTADGRTVNAAIHKRHFTVATKETAPYRIRANTFANQPNEICLSPHHALLTRSNVWQIPEFAAKFSNSVQQYGVGEPVTYYHIETANYFRDNLVAEGCVVESFCGKAAESIPKGTPLFKFNSAIGGFTRYSPSKATTKKH